MISKFINRKQELEILNKDWRSKRAELVVVTGRRRIGKTRLIEEFLKAKKGIAYTAKQTTAFRQISEFKEVIAEELNDSFLKKQELKDWSSLFEYLAMNIPQKERFYLFIDEFSYLIKSDPSVTSILQTIWDKKLAKTKIFVILTGSLIGMMTEHVLAHSSPLYGRRTRDLFLEDFTMKDAQKFLPKYGWEEKFQIYGVVGGVPSYLLKASEENKFKEFVNREFFNKQGFFYREPYYILSQEFKELKTYYSILNAIAFGKHKATEIANFCGIDTRKIFPYLNNLTYLNFVKKETPITVSTKYGHYFLKDKMIDFWFNFTDKNRHLIEKGTYRFQMKEFNQWFGRIFEDIVKDNLHILFPKMTNIGRWWHKEKEIDIVATGEKEILFVECKWKEKLDAEKVLEDLKEKSKHVKHKKKEKYCVIAKSFNKKPKGCYDLKDLKKILKR